MEVKELLLLTIQNKASDLHLLVGIHPALRIDGGLTYLTNFPILTSEDIELMIYSILTPEQKELLIANKELDFSYGYQDTSITGRFRINAYYQKGYLAAAFRFLPTNIRTVEQLKLPNVCHSFAKLRQGFVLITGPTGHGKSSTLAAILNEVNMNIGSHILTIEDPIEYIYPAGTSIVSQRELGADTHSWAMALKSALREDPDVVLVGEMRDPETMQAALTIAETGHLVFSTLHTNSAAQSIDRIIDAFPPHQKPQIRIQLAATLSGVVSQRLIPQIGGGRNPAVEVLLSNSAVANNIREGKTHLIDSIIQTSKEEGMITLESSLAQMVLSGLTDIQTAQGYAIHGEELHRLVGDMGMNVEKKQ